MGVGMGMAHQVQRVRKQFNHSCFKDFIFLSLIFSHSKAELLGQDVKIKFIFDSYDYDNQENTSSMAFPFSYDIRNISLVEYYRDKEDDKMDDRKKYKEDDTLDDRVDDNEDGTMHAGRDEKEDKNMNDRRDVLPGRSLDIGKDGQDKNYISGVLGEKRCVDKVVIETITEYKEEIKCDHSYDKQCHTSYLTAYDGQQIEECEENFVKVCYIEYEQRAVEEKIKVCSNPLVKTCDSSGPEICQTIYQAECWTKQERQTVQDDIPSCITKTETSCTNRSIGYVTSKECKDWPRRICQVEKKPVTKYNPITSCRKEPVELCAPAGCGHEKGPEQCHDKTITTIQDIPKESCTLDPHRSCKAVTKLVPRLEPSEECVDVPKEVCARVRGKAFEVEKPTVKKWCYTRQ